MLISDILNKTDNFKEEAAAATHDEPSQKRSRPTVESSANLPPLATHQNVSVNSNTLAVRIVDINAS